MCRRRPINEEAIGMANQQLPDGGHDVRRIHAGGDHHLSYLGIRYTLYIKKTA
jgi:hypothetical protein